MPRKVLIRDISDDLYERLRERAFAGRTSQNEVLRTILRDALSQQEIFAPPAPVAPIQAPALPFSFIDLFAGIGGMRIGLQEAGGNCLFSSEWDKHCQATYHHWFKEMPAGDITKVRSEDIPDHDVLAAGFPCQPFSIAGVSKKKSLGRAHGFKDKTQGTLFFTLARIIDDRRPPVLLLENVKNLMSHDGGNTWRVIRGTLEELDYVVHAKVIDAAGWVPQHRERIFVVGFAREIFGEGPPFEFPTPPDRDRPILDSILEPQVDQRYTLSNHLWRYLRDYADKHKAKGNGFGFGLADPRGITRTLSARYHKDGSEILIPQRAQNPRRLTPKEAALLMGFPPRYAKDIRVSDTQAYRQFGNAVVPKVVESIGRAIVRSLWHHISNSGNRCLIKRVGPPRSNRRTA